MSTDIKLSITQISKRIQSGSSFGSCLNKLGKKALTKITISLAIDNLPGLIGKFERNYIEIELWKQE